MTILSSLKASIKSAVKIAAWIALGSYTSSGLAVVTVRRGLAKGTRMRLDVRKEGSYWLGTCDDWILDKVDLTRFVHPGDVVWDCGSCRLLRRNFPTARRGKGTGCHFEASRPNCERLFEFPLLNGWDNVDVHQLAIGPERTEIDFVANLGGSSVPHGLSKTYPGREPSLQLERVRCFGTDELVQEHGIPAPDFIKFDLESAEEYALLNGHWVFSVKKPILLLELHGRQALVATGKFLDLYGYRAINVTQIPQYAEKAVAGSSEINRWAHVPHMLLCVPPGVPFTGKSQEMLA